MPCTSKTLLALALAAVMAGGLASPAHATAPEGVVRGGAENPVPGNYVVKLKDAAVATSGVARTVDSLVSQYGGRAEHVLTQVMRGYVVDNLGEQQARRLAAHPAVESVIQSGTSRAGDTQDNPVNWGLDRVDQRDRPLDRKYTYPSHGGQGVNVYIVDTGIRYSHQEFDGRAKFAADFIVPADNGNDCNGHGTHVAGITGGETRGVAKKVTLHSVRILDCNGRGKDSDVVVAAEWLARNAIKPAVANLSVYTDNPSIAVDAIKGSIAAGVQWALITGNNGGNSCDHGPGPRVETGVRTGNATSSDARAGDSNDGACMDLFAPGSGIDSSFHQSDSSYGQLSGTSMAAPHVAGTLALRLSEAPSSTPADLKKWVVDNATTGKMTNIRTGTPNRLLHLPAGNPQPGNDFSISASPSSVSADPGQSAGTTISTAVTRGAAQNVRLSASGQPAGVTASFDPSSVTAGGSSRLSLSVGASVTPGTYNLTVTGTGTDATRTANVSLKVNGEVPPGSFTLTADPAGGSVAQGSSVTTTISATSAFQADGESGVAVVGGTPTTVAEYPFIISQHRTGGVRPQEQSCTGSVVAPRKVLIAAHCKFSQGDPKYLIYGRDDLANTDTGTRIEIAEYKAHPSYNPSDGWRTGFDVAIITTTTDIPTPAGMAYPPIARSTDSLPVGTRGTAVGYGKSDANDANRNTKLYEAVLPVAEDQNCRDIAGHFDARYMFCNGYSSGGPSLCQGDSGGPYLHNGKIYGVFSWLRTDCAYYQAHARMHGVLGDWANQEIGSTNPPTGDITLSASGLPSGATASFNPGKIAVGSGSRLTIGTTSSTPVGTYEITVTGTKGTESRTVKYSLTVTTGNPGPTDLSLTNPGTQTSVKGRAVTLQLVAEGGSGGYRFSATGLPAGLSVNTSTGLISGTPTTWANYNPRVTATDSAGASVSQSFYWFVFPY
ncbi:subtilisin family serine protease [Saccharothrix carnea]|uniref:Subtilisin family serine protease n=1 Tax=Saccharothrix carnea TaxID=1280637 RepID=A0A2P8HLS2_SACCR|nr:trypsin-like serine protease [Saccharothrix carnea]PSL47150.1 subtilisin family serine protease [Saccharothrix carnea]